MNVEPRTIIARVFARVFALATVSPQIEEALGVEMVRAVKGGGKRVSGTGGAGEGRGRQASSGDGRERLIAELAARPDQCSEGMADTLEISRNRTRQICVALWKSGHAERWLGDNNKTFFYRLTGAADLPGPRKEKIEVRVLEYLRRNPGQTRIEIAAGLDAPPVTVGNVCGLMLAAGDLTLVEAVAPGVAHRYEVAS